MLSYDQSNQSSSTQSLDKNNEQKVLNPALADYDVEFFDHETTKKAVQDLESTWKKECEVTEERRTKRYLEIDAELERQKGNLDADECWSPMRVINTNIMREQPKYAAYLTKSSRMAIFSCNEDPSVDSAVLEKDYTVKSRYKGWEQAYLKLIDGTETHGWDAIEVVYDESKPGHFSREHIGHENFWYPPDTLNTIQVADYCLRIVTYTPKDVLGFVKNNGWNLDQVMILLGKLKESKQNQKSKAGVHIKVQKVFFKNPNDGLVYVGWMNFEYCDKWLREPKPLYLGRVVKNPSDGVSMEPFSKVYETEYPIELFSYMISENERIMDQKGRVFFDEDKQEIATSLMTSFTTGVRRSSANYWARDGQANSMDSMDSAQTDVRLLPNKVFNQNVKQYQLMAPGPVVPATVNMILGQAQMESGDVNYAVQSNKSTRKTAAEVNLAKNENDLLSGVQVTLLSITIRNTEDRCFSIYSSRVKAGLIETQPKVLELLTKYTWTLKPSGDTDVIERNQKIQIMQEAWPVYQSTGASKVFLRKLTELLFPDEASQYIEAMQQEDDKLKLIQAIENVIKIFITDPNVKQKFTLSNGMPDPEILPYLQKFLELSNMGQQIIANEAQMAAKQSGKPSPSMPQSSSPQLINPPAPQPIPFSSGGGGENGISAPQDNTANG